MASASASKRAFHEVDAATQLQTNEEPPARSSRPRHVIPVRSKHKHKHSSIVYNNRPGLLVACDPARETEAMSAALIALNKYADEMYPRLENERAERADVDGFSSAPVDPAAADPAEGADEADSEEEQTAPVSTHIKSGRFSVVDCGKINGLVYLCVSFPADRQRLSVSAIAGRAMEEAAVKREITKHIHKIIPVQATCPANDDRLVQVLTPLVSSFFSSSSPCALRFAVSYRCTNNAAANKSALIAAAAKCVADTSKITGHTVTVDLRNPDFTIFLWVAKSALCVSVLDQDNKYRHYNIDQVEKMGIMQKGEDKQDKPATAKADADDKKE